MNDRLVEEAKRELDPMFHRYIDPSFGNVGEMVMHAIEAYFDRNEA